MKILVPSLGESITEATVAKWLKKKGDLVKKDEVLVELETDKATLEVYAQTDGKLSEIYFEAGKDVEIGAELADYLEGAQNSLNIETKQEVKQEGKQEGKQEVKEIIEENIDDLNKNKEEEKNLVPENIFTIDVKRSGAGNKITKNDLQELIGGENLSPSQRRTGVFINQDKVIDVSNNKASISAKNSTRVPMTRLQRTMGERLKSAQNTAAMLTTFNEVDMSNIIKIRKNNKDNFEKKFNIKLGFMSFFCKAVAIALKEIPIINSEIDGSDIIYHNRIELRDSYRCSTRFTGPSNKRSRCKIIFRD